MNYPMYSNNQFYVQDLQSMKDRIDNQIKQIQRQSQAPQPVPQPITQNFQIAPNPNNNNDLEGKYVENIEEVKNIFVMKTGVFLNKDLTTLWIKNTSGNIKAYNLEEIIERDPKDEEILLLKKQIEEMKGMIENDRKSDNSNVDVEITTKKSSRVPSNKSGNAK